MPGASFLILCGVAIVLVTLAILQYRWITQISEAEEKRQKENLEIATTRFAEDFSGEFRLLFPNRRPGPPEFGPDDPAGQLARQYDQWMSGSRYPALLQDLYAAEVAEPGVVNLSRFNPQTRNLEPVEWPSEFSEFHRNAVAESVLRGGRRGGPRGRGLESWGLEHIPALSFAMLRLQGPPQFGGPRGGGFGPLPVPSGWEIIRLDRKTFRETFLPSLVERHYSKQGDFDYDVLIAESAAGNVVYRSSPNLDLSNFKRDTDTSLHLTANGFIGFGGLPRGGPPLDGRFRPPGPAPMGGWDLYANHRAGSLQSFADQFRRRNLIVSFGVLGILAIGIAFTFLSSERVRALGRMQLEFAAGLSHELRTPLTVIRSAGYNLAVGNVTGHEDVARYGKVLQEQGLRLSDMVDQALLFAQAQSGRNQYERTPVELAGVIDRAIDSCRAILSKYPCEIAANVEPALPLAMTEPHALGQCLHNLLMNALKYGRCPGAVIITARKDATKAEIEIAVENEGTGIHHSDVPHIFEPFFRGKNTSEVSGSGLGLYIVKSIVESLDGRVDVFSSEAKTRFTLHIPSVPERQT